METPQAIPIQTRAITVTTASDGAVSRDCVVWYDREHAGYRAMYVREAWRDLCEVLLTDPSDPECCTGKKDYIMVITPYLRRFMTVLRTHEPHMPHLRGIREYVHTIVQRRDDLLRQTDGSMSRESMTRPM